jgi:hypothetical protein
VVSVQVVRAMHRAVLLIIRRSWVRAPPAPPAVSPVASVEPWTDGSDSMYCHARTGGRAPAARPGPHRHCGWPWRSADARDGNLRGSEQHQLDLFASWDTASTRLLTVAGLSSASTALVVTHRMTGMVAVSKLSSILSSLDFSMRRASQAVFRSLGDVAFRTIN